MYRKQLEEYFALHRQEMVDDICRLVRIDSTKAAPQAGMPFGEGPAAALEAAMDIAGGMGFAVTDYDHYVAAFDLNDKPTRLDILAHLDVVPGGDNWTVTTPFQPVIKDGRIFGRGTSDDKGPAVAALYAMRAVKELRIPLSANVRLILGTDEESGSEDIAYYYQRQKEAPMTFSPDADFPVIHIEKGRAHGVFSAAWEASDALPRLTAFHSGQRANVIPAVAEADVLGMTGAQAEPFARQLCREIGIRFRLTESEGGLHISAEGTGAHAAQPQDGNNALTGLLELLCRLPLVRSGAMRRIEALRAMFPHGDCRGQAAGVARHDDLSGDTTLVCTVLHLNDRGLTGEFDGRTTLDATCENTVDVLTEKMAHGGMTLDCQLHAPHHVPADSPLVQELLRCYEMYTGQKGEPLAIGGGTYVHDLKSGVAFGCVMPGMDTHMHSADEYMDIHTLLLSAQMFAQAIIDLCQ